MSWSVFKDKLFKAQEQFLPTCRKRSKHGRRPAQNKVFLTKLNAKRKYRSDGLPRRNIEMLPEYAGLELERPKLRWS